MTRVTEKYREKNPRGIVSAGAYWVDSLKNVQHTPFSQEIALRMISTNPLHQDRGLINSINHTLPFEGRVDRVEYSKVNPDHRQNPHFQTLIMGALHGNEQEAPLLWWEQTAKSFQIPHIEVLNAHALATLQDRRESPIPVKPEDLKYLTQGELEDIAILANGGVGGIGLDEVVDAYHEDIALAKLSAVVQINPNYMGALKLQLVIKKLAKLSETGERIEVGEEKLNEIKQRLLDLSQENEGNSWTLSRKVNLNRQFPIDKEATRWEEIEKNITYPEARMLLQMVKDNPDIKYLFTLHEDPEHGIEDTTNIENRGIESALLAKNGVYLYDAHRDARNDNDRELVDRLQKKFFGSLIERGFNVLNGTDDENDIDLRFEAHRGYIDQPNVDEKGNRLTLDKTFESAFVEIGRLGLKGVGDKVIQAERAFCLEIPGRLSPERKAELLQIYQQELMIPFLAAHNIK